MQWREVAVPIFCHHHEPLDLNSDLDGHWHLDSNDDLDGHRRSASWMDRATMSMEKTWPCVSGSGRTKPCWWPSSRNPGDVWGSRNGLCCVHVPDSQFGWWRRGLSDADPCADPQCMHGIVGVGAYTIYLDETSSHFLSGNRCTKMLAKAKLHWA
jgi:hypothetical protein